MTPRASLIDHVLEFAWGQWSALGVPTLFDAMPQLGWIAQPDGFIHHYNRGWYAFTGSTPEEILGWGSSSVHDPEELPVVVQQWKHCIETDESFEATLQLRRHDGVLRWFLTRASPVRDLDGRIVRWVGVSTDIDDVKRAAEPAAASDVSAAGETRRLKNTVRLREDLLATVSHDLRNPLNIIVMAAKQIELLDDEEAESRCKRSARTILKAAERMTRLISDLLDVSKLEVGQRLSFDLGTHEVVDLAREAVDLLEPLARAKELSLSLDAATHASVLCDGERVQRVFSNLIGNAIKFTPGGGSICVRTRTTRGEVIVSVTDTGRGISADQLPRIFDRSWQHDAQPERGAGLGLYIAKGIIEAHGGRIWVESTMNTGSTFHFSLPESGAMSHGAR